MLDLAFIENYYRANGCTCEQPPVKPGDDHEAGCQTLFGPLGHLKRLKRILLVLSPTRMANVFARGGLSLGRGLGLAGRRFARRIRRCVTVGAWPRLCVGGLFPQKQFLLNNLILEVRYAE